MFADMGVTVQSFADHSPESESKAIAWRAALFVAALTVARAVFAASLELAGDEAYYWLWSRRLDIGYYSKGPGVAWAIAAATRMFGDAEWAVRLPAVVASAVSSWALYGLSRRLHSPQAALWTLLIAATMPILLAGSVLMTIDPLSVAAWLVGAVAALEALRTGRLRHWIVAGLAVAAGTLAKFTNLAELLSFAIAAAVWPDRRRLRRPGLWAAAAIGLLGLVPPLLWNLRHGWVTLHHLGTRGALDQPFRGDVPAMLAFLATQAAVISPVYAWALIEGIRRHRRWVEAATLRFLAAFIVPLPLGYAVVSLNGEWEPNWTAPALAMTPVLLAVLWCSAVQRAAGLRHTARRMVAAHAVLALGAHVVLLGPWVFGNDRFRRIGGARDLAARVDEVRRREQCDAVVAGGYQLAALLTYYTPHHPPVYTPPSDPPKHQFAFWPGYRDRHDVNRVLFVAKSEQVPDELRSDFLESRPLGWVQPVYRGRPMRPHHLTVLDGRRGRRGRGSGPEIAPKPVAP